MKDKKTSSDEPIVNQDGEFNQNDKQDHNEVEALKKQVADLEKQNAELDELVKFQVANQRNTLKRRDETEHDLRKYGAKQLGQLLVPELELLKTVLASLEKHDNKELKNYLMGFEMVVKKISNDLEEVGINQIPLKVGDQFDEKTQEAIEQVESDLPVGSIVEIVNNGYLIYDKVLVHARVKIAGAKKGEEEHE